MKWWVNKFILVFNLIMTATATILIIIFSIWDNDYYSYFAIIPIVLQLSINVFMNLIPDYSTKKYLNFFYEQSFVGCYEADLKYKAYKNSDQKLIQGINKISFCLEISDEGKIIKKQKTNNSSNSISESESYIISLSKKKKKIVIYLKYIQKANYKDNSDRMHNGYEIIEFDKKQKQITNSIYFTEKPSSGEIINIKKIK